MDIQPTNQNPVTDDQELAKVLAGVSDEASHLPAADPGSTDSSAGLQFEETPVPPADSPAPDHHAFMATDPAAATDPPATEPEPVVVPPVVTPVPGEPAPTPPKASPELEGIKKDALEELRPLVSKLDLPAEEKFDTMLLIIRSTDDQSLVKLAHEAAKEITDETKRAQALLDIIKEIDYFSIQHAA